MSLLNNPKIRALLKRKYQGVASGGPPIASPPALVQNDTVYIPMGFAANLVVEGRVQAGDLGDLDAATFESSDTSIFIVGRVAPIELNPYNNTWTAWEAQLVPRAVGTATLTITADVETQNEPYNMSVVPITDTLTVVVYRVATQLVFYFTEQGSTDELPANDGAGNPYLQIPKNKTATLRVEGQDDAGNVVPLSSVVFDSMGSGNYHFVATSDPNTYTVVPDGPAGGSPATVSADGDPSPSASNLSTLLDIEISEPATATTLVESYSLTPL